MIVGLITAVVTIIGWLVTRKLEIERRATADARTDRTRRIELRLRYYERQIQEFYGPIYSLIQLIWSIWAIKERFEKELSPDDNKQPIHEVRSKIDSFIGTAYFTPIHEEIRGILKTRLFLIEGAQMPDSFYEYLVHSMMENVQHSLWTKEGISTLSVKGQPWSYEFPKDIEKGLDDALKNYDRIIKELESERENVVQT